MSIKSRIFVVISLIMLLAMACSLPGMAPGTTQPEAQQVPAGQPTAAEPAGGDQSGAAPSNAQPANPGSAAQEPTATLVPTDTPVPTPTATPLPPSHPLGIRQGLAGLNSYRFQTIYISQGPTDQDSSETKVLTEYNKEGDQLHVRTEITARSADDPQGSTQVTEEYRIGDQTCTFSPGSDDPTGTIETASASQLAMLNGVFNLFDMVVFAEEPVLVGAEQVNGILCNHFTFQVNGMGAGGAEVTNSSGEYWIAQEGQYLVKYHAALGTRSAPAGDAQAEVMYLEISLDLTDVDQPISVTMPADCK